MPYVKEEIGNCIVAARGRNRISRNELARRTGIPESTLKNYENAQTKISLQNAWRIADAFSTGIDDLFER